VYQDVPTDVEIERALRRAWFPVARVGDLHQPRRVHLLGETLVVYLTDDKEPRIAVDRCAHRGGSLADGHVRGDRIVCPYHGWQWRGDDGKCMHIPSIGETAGIPSKAVIATHHGEERWGLVWCCLDEPAVDLPSPDAPRSPPRPGWDISHRSTETCPSPPQPRTRGTRCAPRR
jgi:phenylpropionate dioxygenase-like ring-hydroxylating dioxygenase large terminal subunit